VKKRSFAAFLFAAILLLSVSPLSASAALLPSAWAEDELELVRQWGLLDARSDSSPGNPEDGSSDGWSSWSGRNSGSWSGWSRWDSYGYGAGPGLQSPESYTAGITKDAFCQIVVSMCEKLKGESLPAADVRFSDENAPGYYYRAYEAGIIDGTGLAGDGAVILGRDGALSREQIAKMLYQAIVYCYPDQAVDAENAGALLAAFSDSDRISGWALGSAAYMTKNGILKGSGGQFLPQEQCTFEQGVILAKRVYETFEEAGPCVPRPCLKAVFRPPSCCRRRAARRAYAPKTA
jgi:hypothetical protein